MFGLRRTTATLGRLPAGDAGTRATLATMQRLAVDGSKDLDVRSTALSVLRASGVASHDHKRELEALYRFVRDRVAFRRDVYGVETLQAPRVTLQQMAGDCDDRAILLAAMLRAVGSPATVRFRVIAADPRRASRFTHVYVMARLGGRDIALDPTYQGTPAGWQHPSPLRVGELPA